VLPLSQTAANVDFDEFLAGLDAETRAYVQELIAGLGIGLKGNGRTLSADLRRFDPTAQLAEKIAQQLEIRHTNIARSIHNFRVLVQAVGGKDQQLSQLVDASNAVFATFSKEDANFQETLKLLPAALRKTGTGLGKLATATKVLGPTLKELEPFARALGPANEATRQLAKETTPIIKNDVRPFAREILPVVNELGPATKQLGEAFPKLSSGFSVFNEFFNELAYNPGPSKGGFLFFLDWGNHDLNSVVSTSDSEGAIGRTLVYFNCKVLPILKGVAEINPTVNLLVSLLKPPTGEECVKEGITSTATATSERGRAKTPSGGPFSNLGQQPFGGKG
jgi:phospholipid/cholesterol/gamma-HCH transport system substrate-binding protein